MILGRLFLATIGCHIDVKAGKLSFDVGNYHVEFNLFKLLNSLMYLMSAMDLMSLTVWCGKPLLTMILMNFLSIVY